MNVPVEPGVDRTGQFIGIEGQLQGLGATAPASLAPASLMAVGLADWYAPARSPIGDILVAWNGLGVSFIGGPEDHEGFEAAFRAEFARPLTRVSSLPAGLGRAIERRLAGDRRVRIALDLRGRTPFELAVWRKTVEIPRGEVRPYSWVAAEIGRPRAVRAVGTALAHNPIPLVVPCHRVVRSDGTIGQYSMGGPSTKRAILRVEGLDPDDLEAQARAGIRLVGSDTTRIVCLPSCHNARRIIPAHRVPFRSLADSATAGFRPCRECRPSAAGRAA